MNFREALITQSPSLALQRAAADEIARLDAVIRTQASDLERLRSFRDAVQAEQGYERLAAPAE